MVTDRLEVRLDPDHRRKLSELAASRRAPVSELVREMIDRAYDEATRERRLQIVNEISALEVEDVPDPDELSRQLARKYDDADISGH